MHVSPELHALVPQQAWPSSPQAVPGPGPGPPPASTPGPTPESEPGVPPDDVVHVPAEHVPPGLQAAVPQQGCPIAPQGEGVPPPGVPPPEDI